MSERLSNRWSMPPGPRLAYDREALARPANNQTANSGNQNSARDRELIDRLAAELEIDPASLSKVRTTESLAPENEDLFDRLVGELNDARARRRVNHRRAAVAFRPGFAARPGFQGKHVRFGTGNALLG